MMASHVNIAAFFVQKGFAMLCGFTIFEHVRSRRLALGLSNLVTTSDKLIDLALNYGCLSLESITKAFTRIHGVSPTSVCKGDVMLKSIAPLIIKVTLERGYLGLVDFRVLRNNEQKKKDV